VNKIELRTIRLLEMLQLQKRLDVRTVAATLEISEATARRLFSQLEREGKIIRVHGGVQLSPPMGYDYSYRLSSHHRSREKSLIGRAAAELVEDGDRIFLDSGTTVLQLAEALSLKIQTGTVRNLVVLTNSLSHIESLARWCKVILIGGEIRVERRDVCGTLAEKNLSLFHVDKAFFGADAVSPTRGLMTTDERTSRMNEIVLKSASRAFVLADSEKFDRTSFVSYAALEEVETIYTDSGLRGERLELFRQAGARIEPVPLRAGSETGTDP
jgi:DeoR/GlpR family transcriptional regulator of sugar metabolism